MNKRKIDCLIARHIFNKPWEWSDTLNAPVTASLDAELYPLYSSSIAAAWEVVEKLGGVSTGSGYCVDISYDGGWIVSIGNYCESNQDTAPMAICLAALKAKGVEVPE